MNDASSHITPALHAGLLSMWWKPAAQQKLTREQEDLARAVFLDIMEGDHRVPDMYRNEFRVLPSVSAASAPLSRRKKDSTNSRRSSRAQAQPVPRKN